MKNWRTRLFFVVRTLETWRTPSRFCRNRQFTFTFFWRYVTFLPYAARIRSLNEGNYRTRQFVPFLVEFFLPSRDMKWGICYFFDASGKKDDDQGINLTHTAKLLRLRSKNVFWASQISRMGEFLPCSVKVHRLGLQHTAFP